MHVGWHRLAAVDRRWALTVTVGLLVGLASAGAVSYWQDAQLRNTRRSLDEAFTASALEKSKADALARSSASRPEPWWTLLPTDGSVAHGGRDSLTSDAMASGSQLNVRISRMSMSPLPSADGAPYQGVAIQIELRGTYPDIKRWLGELLARRSHSLALKSMDMRRTAEGAAQLGVEASIELRLFERSSH